MQFTFLSIPILMGLAIAIPPPPKDWLDAKVPDCGRDCLNEGYKRVGCDIKDYQCRCNRGRELFNTPNNPTLHCIETQCSNKEHDRLNAVHLTICEEIYLGNTDWFNKTFHLFPSLVDA